MQSNNIEISLFFSGKEPGQYSPILNLGSAVTSGVMISNNGSLIIMKAHEQHQGQYLCEADNNVGAGLSTLISITVNG